MMRIVSACVVWWLISLVLFADIAHAAPVNVGQSCVTDIDGDTQISFTHSGLPASTSSNRMVVVMWSGEEPTGTALSAATATYNGVPMQSLVFRGITSAADNYTQIFALKHSALPAAAGAYNVVISGVSNDAAACAFTLTGVDQTYPAGTGATFPVNSNSQPTGVAVIATTIKPALADSYVMAIVGNGAGNNAYNHSLSTELLDISTGGPQGANVSISAQALSSANTLTVTDTYAGGVTGSFRSTQAVVAFAPPLNYYFRVAHAGSGGVCAPTPITISTVNGAGTIDGSYTGTIQLSAAGGGDWTLGPGAFGTLDNGTAGDGIATYTFVAVDTGDVVLNYSLGTSGTVNFNVTDLAAPARVMDPNPVYDADLVVGACKFRVSYTGGATADVCSKQEVIITAVDQSGVLLTKFTGQVLLTTTTGHGTWEKSTTQPGTLTDPVANDGSASYTFVAGDNGDVALLLNTPLTETLKVGVQSLDGAIRVDSNPSYDPNLVVGPCKFRVSYINGALSSCTAEQIKVTVYDSSNAIATGYTGKVTLATRNNDGDWVSASGTGAFSNGAADDGVATYQFVASDVGTTTLTYRNIHEGVLNVNVADSIESAFVEDASYDPDLDITPCLVNVSPAQCYRSQNQSNALTLKSSSATNGSRMVLMYVASESLNTASNPRLVSGVASYSMTLLRTESLDSSSDVRLQVFGILDANLPTAAGAVTASFDGTYSAGVNDPSMCLVSLEGAQQLLPSAASPATNGPLNSAAGSATSSSVTLTTRANNAVVFNSLVTASDSVNFTSPTDEDTTLWSNGTSSPGPRGARFVGFSGQQVVAGSVKNTISGSGSMSAYAHIALAINPIVAGNPYAKNYVPVHLFDTLSGNLNYRAIGKSLRTLPDDAFAVGGIYPNSCTMGSSSSSTLTLPAGSSIEKAYLYWAGSGGTADIDRTVNFARSGGVTTSVTADDVFQIINASGISGSSYFLGYKDVTGLVSTNASQTYTVSGLTVMTGSPWNSTGTGVCVGGWALVVVYKNATENPYVTVVNIFHGFQPFFNSSFALTPRNFRIAAPSTLLNLPRGQITHVTFEGDSAYSGVAEAFELQNDPTTLSYEALTNAANPAGNQYNGTISYPAYDSSFKFTGYTTESSTSYGTDVDTYYIAGPKAVASDSKEDILYPFGLAAAEQITTRYGAAIDLVLLSSEFIAVTNASLADLEVFTSSAGTFTVGSTGTGSVNFAVVNNGDNATSNGFATGTVVLTGRLPSGLTINTMNPGAHWSCSNTTTAFTCTFDIETWTGGTYDTTKLVYRLDDGLALPPVAVTVNVGTYTSFPLLSNLGLMTGRIAHFDTSAAACVATSSIGYQPDPAHASCVKAEEFDNVNDLNKNTIDIDDLTQKQANNNNVDRTTFAITGVRSDLGIKVRAIGAVQTALAAEYQMVITNYGPDATTNTHPMTAVLAFPAGLTPLNPGTVDGWTCNLAATTLTCSRTAPLASGASSTIAVTTIPVTQAVGSYVTTSGTITSGSYNFDNVPTNNASTDVSRVVGAVVPLDERFLISVSEAATLGSTALSFDDEDLVLYDPNTDLATMFMDTSSLSNTLLADLDAVHVLPNGWIVLSADADSTLLGLNFSDEDLVLYDPILRTAQLIFDGSDANKFGVNAAAADVDALHIDYNNSWNPASWDIYLSTTADSSLNGTALDDNDVVKYSMSTGVVTTPFNGANANKFAGDSGNVGGFYIRYDDADNYLLATADATATIDSSQAFTRDDLVEWDGSAADGAKARRVFVGNQPPSVFLPSSATRELDGVHVVEDGYYGHFAISALDGSSCTAAKVTITKHAGLIHTTQSNYQGSIRITSSSPTTDWLPDASNKGTFVDLGGGVALYTFAAADNGAVLLGLGESSAVSNIDITVTNYVVGENSLEDAHVDVTLDTIGVNYVDDFDTGSYGGNDGSTPFAANWVEQNDNGMASSGDLTVIGGKLRLRDSGGAPFAAVYRTIDFDYTADISSKPVVLKFKWARTGGSNVDTVVVEWSQNSGASWQPLGPALGSASSGAIAETLASFDLTAAGVNATIGEHLWLRFRVASGLASAYVVEVDDVELITATRDCTPGYAVHHYHIQTVGSTVACLAEPITITAHDIAHNPVAPGAGVVLNISTSSGKGGWNPPIVGGGAFAASPITNNGLATYTFLAGETSITLPFNYTELSSDPEVVGFNVIDNSAVIEQEDDTLAVSRAGLRFYNDTDGSAFWPTLTAGRPATGTLDYTGKTLVVQAVRVSDANPTQCEALFPANSVRAVKLLFECTTPGVCSASNLTIGVHNNSSTTSVNTVNNNGSAWINSGDEAEFTTVNLLFQDFGAYNGARVQLNSPDVGRYQIHGRYNIPLNNDGTGAAGISGNYMQGSGPTFVVRPFGLDVDFGLTGDDRRSNTDASRASGAASPAYGKAGEVINVSVRGVAWDAADDINGDGAPDFEADLSDNAMTPSFGQEGVDYRIGLSVITDNPTTVGLNDNPGVPGGVVGSLLLNSNLFSFTNGVSAFGNTVTFNEVGIFDVQAVLLDAASTPVNYLSSLGGNQPVVGGAANVGRITPFYYDVVAGTSFMVERPNAGGAATFTYMGEPFEVTLALEAKALDGQVLQNYFGSFAKLTDVAGVTAGNTTGQLVFKAFKDQDGAGVDDTDYNTRVVAVPSSFHFTSAWAAGLATLNGRLIFNRQAGDAPEAPLTPVTIAVDLKDSDNIDEQADVGDDDGTNETSNYTWHQVDSNQWRYGRLRLENAYGSELQELDDLNNPIGRDVAMPLVAEYWDGTKFAVNTADSGTPFDITHLLPVTTPRYPSLPDTYTDNLTDGEFLRSPGVSKVAAGETLAETGPNHPFYFRAPGEGNDGSVVMEFDLDAANLGFLKYDWRSENGAVVEDEDANGVYQDFPRALLEFGTYKGNDRIINWQELFIQEP
jgi:hypothetical protein